MANNNKHYSFCKIVSGGGLGASFDANLKVQCKSHKPAGRVGWRNLHCCPLAANFGLSSWVAQQLSELLVHSYLPKSTGCLIEMLRSTPVDASCHLYRLDVDQFFMSGSCPSLVKHTSCLFEGQRRAVVGDAVKCLLEHQYVSSSLSGQTCKVLQGSGMGLKHSAGIAGAAFHSLADRWVMSPGVRKKFGIRLYARYVDDLLFITDTDESNFLLFLRWLRHRLSAVFTLENVALHQCSVEMLDLQVSIVANQLCWEPRRCQIMAAPLSVDSAHPLHVHASWPVGMMLSTYRLSSSHEAFERHGKLLIERFERFSTPSWLVARLRRVFGELCAGRVAHKKAVSMPVDIFHAWCPISWHPMWKAGHLQKGLEQLSLSWNSAMSFELGQPFKVAIAWRRRLPHFIHLVQRRTLVD